MDDDFRRLAGWVVSILIAFTPVGLWWFFVFTELRQDDAETLALATPPPTSALMPVVDSTSNFADAPLVSLTDGLPTIPTELTAATESTDTEPVETTEPVATTEPVGTTEPVETTEPVTSNQ